MLMNVANLVFFPLPVTSLSTLLNFKASGSAKGKNYLILLIHSMCLCLFLNSFNDKYTF